MTETNWRGLPVAEMRGLHPFHSGLSTCSQAVRMALHEKELSWEGHSLDMRANEHLVPEYTAINPNAVVPTLVHDGKIIVETWNILAYLDELAPKPTLFFSDPDTANAISLWHDRWVIFKSQSKMMSFEFLFRDAGKRKPEHLAAYVASHPNSEYVAFQQAFHSDSGFPREQVTQAVAIAQKGFSDLDKQLSTRPYIAGKEMSVVDLLWLPKVHRLEWMHFPLDQFPAVAEWHQRMLIRESAQTGIVAHEPKHIRQFLSKYSLQRNQDGTGVSFYLQSEPELT